MKCTNESSGNTPFRLRRASFSGRGLQPEFIAASWQQMREAAGRDHPGLGTTAQKQASITETDNLADPARAPSP